MKKLLFYFLTIILFGLSGWQVSRFFDKRAEAIFFDEQDVVIDSNHRLFISNNVGDLYFWQGKKYQFNIENNKIYIAFESFIDNNDKKKSTNSYPLKQNLYFKNTICGSYLKSKAFIIYNPIDVNGFTKSGYSIIVPLIFNDELFLVKYFWSEVISDAQLEVENLNNSNLKSEIPEILNVKNNLGLCFNGILIEKKRYVVNNLVSFFVKNDIQNNQWNNLNNKDLILWLENEKISDFLLDTTINNLMQFKKQYKHHIFYAIMWFIMAIYSIFLLKKYKI